LTPHQAKELFDFLDNLDAATKIIWRLAVGHHDPSAYCDAGDRLVRSVGGCLMVWFETQSCANEHHPHPVLSQTPWFRYPKRAILIAPYSQETPVQFGIFDHLDTTDQPLQLFYNNRFAYVEAADRAGITSYHIAEHHTTPLGLSPSPNVYLSGVAQRTTNLRFGPLVYILPEYHPLRLIEEVCMLDQMSGGRLEMGLGRGISPFEARNYGINPDDTRSMYEEYTQVLLQGLQAKAFSFAGKHYNADNLPLQMMPLQKPYPPVWLGIGNDGNAERAGKTAANCVALHNADAVKGFVDIWRKNLPASAPKDIRFGQCFFTVIDEDGDRAMDIARTSYLKWRESFHFLYYHNGTSPVQGERAKTFDEVMAERRGFAGTPDKAREFFAREAKISGINYLLGQFYFGAMDVETPLRSIDLFHKHVMPAFA
jgi:alkanesulfonate monooxygenase SsuD/methylene tetrahydromethanopterin reductase-like flavin-dependent oxidoreductase (luciferase family)